MRVEQTTGHNRCRNIVRCEGHVDSGSVRDRDLSLDRFTANSEASALEFKNVGCVNFQAKISIVLRVTPRDRFVVTQPNDAR